ncbi:MAG: DUF3160 domain-containing protein [Peptococcaceae bacterium]|nr:DUF3160 domain-containing protein [Peptococcaceae bacterium]
MSYKWRGAVVLVTILFLFTVYTLVFVVTKKVTIGEKNQEVIASIPATSPWEPPDFEAALPPYEIAPDLSNVTNINDFGAFTERQRKVLAGNGFLVTPGTAGQMYYIYEDNRRFNYPNFITADSVAYAYYVLRNYAVRWVEKDVLYPVLMDLTRQMFAASLRQHKEIADAKVKAAALHNAAYFAVAAHLLDLPLDVPEEIREKVKRETGLIEAHDRQQASGILPYCIDYRRFCPQGYNLEDDKSQRLFRALTWYRLPLGRVGENILPAALLAIALHNTEEKGTPAEELWRQCDHVLTLFEGQKEVLLPGELYGTMQRIFGDEAGAADLANRELTDKLSSGWQQISENASFYFFAPPERPDDHFLRAFSFTERPLPKGLELMAALGSDRACDILSRDPGYEDDYVKNLLEYRKRLEQYDLTAWHSDLRHGELWALQPLLEEYGEGYPSFMRNTAWQDKNLYTALAAWALSRQHTVLRGKFKEPEDGEAASPAIAGYVEPAVCFYARLAFLVRHTREELDSRALLDEALAERFHRLEGLLDFLQRVAEKELEGWELSEREWNRIRYYGITLRSLLMFCAEGEGLGRYGLPSEAENDMAAIGSAFTAGGYAQYEGVGRAQEIFVVFPAAGRLYLGRGVVLSYYEFPRKASYRLAVDEWRRIVQNGEVPGTPGWISSFMVGPPNSPPRPGETHQRPDNPGSIEWR